MIDPNLLLLEGSICKLVPFIHVLPGFVLEDERVPLITKRLESIATDAETKPQYLASSLHLNHTLKGVLAIPRMSIESYRRTEQLVHLCSGPD